MHLANIKTVSRDAGLTPKVPPFLIKVLPSALFRYSPPARVFVSKRHGRFSVEHIPDVVVCWLIVCAVKGGEDTIRISEASYSMDKYLFESIVKGIIYSISNNITFPDHYLAT